MTKVKLAFIAAALVAVAMVCAACSSGAAAVPGIENSVPESTDWIVVLDPTVEQSQPVEEVLGGLIGRVSFNDVLTVVFVRDRSIAQPAVWTKKYTLNRRTKQWRKDHNDQVRSDIGALKQEFATLRGDFVRSGQAMIARSCVLTSLSETSRLIDKSQTRRRPHLIVVSDFLEVCPEESDINLEKKLLGTKTLLPHGRTFSLADVRRAGFLRISSARVATKPERDHLEDLWTAAVASLGLQPDAFWFGERVDQLKEFFPATVAE